MRDVRVLYTLGVACAVVALALSPWPWTALLPAAAGLIWAAYDLVDVTEESESDDTPPTPTRRN